VGGMDVNPPFAPATCSQGKGKIFLPICK